MKNLMRVGALLACLALAGCGGGGGTQTYNPSSAAVTALARDVIRVGDRITIRLTGVPDAGYYVELPIPPSGDIKVNLLDQSFHAVDKTPDELGAEIAQAYRAQKIYKDPIVTVLPEQRYVIVGGDVRAPSNIAWREGMTLMSAIYSCGGFDEFANRRQVRVLRGDQKFYVDCVKAIQDPGQDPPILPNDQIYVMRNPF